MFLIFIKSKETIRKNDNNELNSVISIRCMIVFILYEYLRFVNRDV